jgi:DinB superfamily
MPTAPFGRPAADEFAPYFERYIKHVPTDDLLGFMREQIAEVTALFAPLSEAKGSFAYAPGKWTIKEVLGHMTDTERVFQYRALSIARTDPAPLPGFDQDVWNPNGGFNECTLESLLEQWTLVRRANLAFLESLPKEALMRMGRASDNPCSVRALSYIPAGHVAYHVQILKERYLQ